ncbi:MAG: hypothetical protein ACRER1_07875 [Gammaproteobacteria bacterium]
MFNCERAALVISERLQHRLGLRRDLALRFHVLICIACRRYENQIRWLHEQLRGQARVERSARLDASARERIVARLQAAQLDGGAPA